MPYDSIFELDLVRLAPVLDKRARKLTRGHGQQVDDLVQETMTRVLARHSQPGAHTVRDCARYAFTVLRHLVTEVRRRHTRDRNVVQSLAWGVPGSPRLCAPEEALVARGDLRRCVDALPTRQRDVLELMYGEDECSVTAAAQRMGSKPKQIKTTEKRALDTLKRHFMVPTLIVLLAISMGYGPVGQRDSDEQYTLPAGTIASATVAWGFPKI